MTRLSAFCESLGFDPFAEGFHLTRADAPNLDPTCPTIVVDADPAGAALLREALVARYPAGHPLRVAAPGAAAVDTTVEQLETALIAADSAILIAPLPPEADVRDFRGLVAIIRRLRDPDTGCPWDRAQTHASLKSHLLEEAYETLHALDGGDPAELREELGDLLLQIVLHARIAEQAGEFETSDVIETLATKLVRRHPHVFSDVTAETADEVARNWDELKRMERAAEASADRSALGGVPRAMPALAYADAILGRAERAGFVWPTTEDAAAKIAEEAAELAAARDDAAAEELGDLLLALVSLARRLGLDAEEAARLAASKFADRFRTMETLADERGIATLTSLEAASLLGLWEDAKRRIER